MVTEIVSPQNQIKALEALMKTLDPSVLALPESILKIIPPRPLGYSRHREVIKVRTELTFDPLSAAESAADMTIELILHPARAARLVEYHARDARMPSLESVIDRLIANTFKSPSKTGYEGAVQITVNNVLLNTMMKLAISKDASTQVKGIASFEVGKLKAWIEAKVKLTMEEDWKAHYLFSLKQISLFQDDPEEFKTENLITLPPGAPIGNMDWELCGN